MKFFSRRAPASAAAFLASLALATQLSPAASAAPAIAVDGETVTVPAVVRGAQVFVPMRGVFEKLNARVVYTPPATVVAQKAGKQLVELQLGSRDASVEGAPRRLQAAPFFSGSHVFVPLRLISEAAGATVAYQAHPRIVQITSPRAVAAAPVVVASPADVAAPVTQQSGIPWWVWLLLALVALALLLAFLRRRKSDPVIVTRSTPSDPTITTRR